MAGAGKLAFAPSSVVTRRRAEFAGRDRGRPARPLLIHCRHTAASGEVIAEYPDDSPYPSVLILASVAGRPLHVVAARDDGAKHCYVITAYVPDPAQWGSDFRTRKPT